MLLCVFSYAALQASVALQARIGELVSRGKSIPAAIYTSLDHLSQLDEATDEDNEDIIDSGNVNVSWQIDCNAPQTHKCRGIRVSKCS